MGFISVALFFALLYPCNHFAVHHRSDMNENKVNFY